MRLIIKRNSMIKKKCLICDKYFEVPNWRKDSAKYCSSQCQNKSLKGELNCECKICKKKFHLKPYQISNKTGNCCSKACLNEYKRELMSGDKNHQYGLKGSLNSSFIGNEIVKTNNSITDIYVYVPDHPYANRNGRVVKHRLIVEENYKLFNTSYFENINNKIVLKKSSQVHHIDFDHNNNSINNLIPVTRSEHGKIHTKYNEIVRDNKTGRITGVIKQGELLEKPEAVNQQPNLNSNILEGSTTNVQVQTGSAEDGNNDMSALQLQCN